MCAGASLGRWCSRSLATRRRSRRIWSRVLITWWVFEDAKKKGMGMIFSVSNWEQFQHYKDRNPPWIKLHYELLTSKTWVMLDDASRVLAIAIMLVASRNQGEIDGSEAGLSYIQRVAYLSAKPNLKPLIDSGFLRKNADASSLLAGSSGLHTSARTETETETEGEGEKYICPEPPEGAPGRIPEPDSPVVHLLECTDGQFAVRADDVEKWHRAFPGVDIPQTLIEMDVWCDAHSSRRKTLRGAKKFIVGWLNREQNGGR